jgi:hypothetical protein
MGSGVPRAPFIRGTGEIDYGVPGAAKNTGADARLGVMPAQAGIQ